MRKRRYSNAEEDRPDEMSSHDGKGRRAVRGRPSPAGLGPQLGEQSVKSQRRAASASSASACLAVSTGHGHGAARRSTSLSRRSSVRLPHQGCYSIAGVYKVPPLKPDFLTTLRRCLGCRRQGLPQRRH